MILNVIADSNNQVAKKHKGTNLKLEFTHSKEVIFIEADKGRINQVISNFLSNAIKFTNEGTITATAVVSNINEIVVSITDTGTGIDSEILPRLFTKFATTSTTGTGYGAKIIILMPKELRLDLAYLCIIRIRSISALWTIIISSL